MIYNIRTKLYRNPCLKLLSWALTAVMKKSQFFELVALGDITPAVRAGLAWQRIEQTRGDNQHPRNNRVELSVYFFF